ncbi:MAG: N-acetyltransferase family protein [Promethearchaeota archaeon]|jgi:RimJ/RimL family protein N-acetyltransferase
MKRILELKSDEKIIFRHLSKSDIDGVWNNFNEVVDEGIYLPVFFPVRSHLEKESWYHSIKKEKEICIVAENQKHKIPHNIIGQCEISNSNWDAGSHVGILGIIVRNEYRDLGIGFNLIDFAIRESKILMNKEKITLSCFLTNKRALHLYEKIGFERVGVRKKQFYMDSKYYDEVLMELWIDDYLNKNE